MKQRYKWEVRVGGVLLTLKVERVGGISGGKNNVTRVEKRERECIREGNYSADNLIFTSAAQYFKNYNFLKVPFVKITNED